MRSLRIGVLGALLLSHACVGDTQDHARVEVRSADCIVCHSDDVQHALNPPHEGFPDTCGSCHSNDAWSPAAFMHSWPLNGAHAALECASCHLGDPPVYQGTPTLCVGCHQSDYDRSPYPGHSDFPTTCENCHTTEAWTPAVGGTHPERLRSLRRSHPDVPFLVPGVGAQGGRPEDLGAAFAPGRAGAIIAASRSIAGAGDPAAAAEELRAAVWAVSG